jgi:hypothetical protein
MPRRNYRPGRKPGLFVFTARARTSAGAKNTSSSGRPRHAATPAGTLADPLDRDARIATGSVDRPQPCVGARPPSGAAPGDSATTVTLRASGQPLDFAR